MSRWKTIGRKKRPQKIPLILEPEELDQLNLLELILYETLVDLPNMVPASFIRKQINDRVQSLRKMFAGSYQIPTNGDEIAVKEQVEMTVYSKPELRKQLDEFEPIEFKHNLGDLLYESDFSEFLVKDQKCTPTLWGWTKIRGDFD